MKEHIIVLDDQEVMRDSLALTLSRAGYRVSAFETGKDVLPLVQSKGVDLVITDMQMPEMDGMEVLAKVKEIDPSVPVIVITAFGTIEKAVEAMRLGAFNFITKPFKADEIEVLVQKALEHANVLAENAYLKEEIKAQYNSGEIVGAAKSMESVFNTIEKVASSNATCLIRGQSGTGKELIARAIHYRGGRADKPFIKVNCAALSAGLLESELFGHERGAFTGADKKRKGRFEIADGGTLLLDEISELNTDLQAKLLRVLQEREFEPVGSNETRQVDVRVIATTNRDLEDWVKEGNFREDLFYRLNVITLKVPPLAQRKEDLKDLATHFLALKSRKEGHKEAKTLSDGAWEWVNNYDWPGNIRELENTIERAVILSAGMEISADEMGERPAKTLNDNDEGVPFGRISLAEMEKKLFLGTLKYFGGHRENTAKALGITSRTLREKLSKWGEK